jgi:proteasome lid subunit RPN8/RPN11
MTESCSEGILGNWAPPECPFKISYSQRTLDDIRLAVMDAFFSLPRGGAEIGGVLLGKRDGQDVTILDHLPLDCEHAFGPSFSLSPRDLAHFSALIEESRKNVPGLQPIGWYHSHTRSEIFLSDADLDVHKRYFPHPWQVALVMKPHTFQPMRAGFFFRELNGSYHIEASYLEFILDPLPMRATPGGTATRPAEAGEIRIDSASTGQVGVPGPTAGDPAPNGKSGAAPPLDWPTPAPAQPAAAAGAAPPKEPSEEAVPMGRPDPVLVADTPPGTSDELPFHYMELQPARRWRLTGMIGLTAVLAVGIFGFATKSVWLPRVWSGSAAGGAQSKNVTSLGLELKDEGGELRIVWDRKNPALASATRGTLEISGGGGFPSATRLDASQLATGSFTYKRETERVDVSLSVDGAGGELGRESASFLGKLPDNGTSPATSDTGVTTERDALAVEVERLKRDLKAEVAKNQQLLRSMDVRGGAEAEAERLRDQLNAEMLRNKELEKASKPKDDQLAKLRSDLAIQLAHNKVLGESLDAANAQLKLQQKKRLSNQAADTAKQ